MSIISLDLSSFPLMKDLGTRHWPINKRILFEKCVKNIKKAPWFNSLPLNTADCERISRAMAFSMVSNIEVEKTKIAHHSLLTMPVSGYA